MATAMGYGSQTLERYRQEICLFGAWPGIQGISPTRVNREVGRWGEDIASCYLEQCGLEVLERNWRCGHGEVDVICKDGETIVMVEVKTRLSGRGDATLAPEQAVGMRKRGRYLKLAMIYLAKQSRYDEVRFDVVAVRLSNDGSAYVRHVPDAYGIGYGCEG